MADWIGQRIGAYEITDLLGAGGMAQVYRARQLSIKREVAIKIIGARLAESPEFLKRFEREANTAANLNHAHIVKIFDYGEYNDSLYLVMELLSGGSLADRMRNTPMSLDTVARIVEQVGSALDYAHLKGIIHRDLKPQNVLFDESGDAHLSDFGIAKVLTENTSLTQSGAIIGTPTYMSPEQYRAEVLDGRSDLYSFGVMLFEMLTGQAPFKADTPVVMAIMHLQNPPPKARSLRPDLPVAVEDVLETALAKDPDKRFQSASALAAAFRAAITMTPPAKTPVPPDVETSVIKPAPLAEPSQTRASKPTAIPSGGNRRVVVAGVAGVIVVAALLVTVLSKLAETPTSPTLVPGTVPPVIALNPTATETRTVIIPTNTIQVVVRASATTPPITPTETNTRTVTATAVPPTTAPSITPLPPTSTIAPSPSKVPTTIDPSMLIAATINGRLTQTAIAIQSYTPTPTLTPSNTPNIEQTVAAGVQMTDTAGTAIAVASFTKTPTPTNTPIPATATFSPTATATFTPSLIPPINPSNATNVKQLMRFGRGTVNQSIWSPDGKILALAGGIGVWLYNANDLTQQPVFLEGHGYPVRGLAFSPDGRILASCGDDSTIILWNISNHTRILTLIGHSGPVFSVAFSPDGKTIASGGNDSTARMWDISSGALLHTLNDHVAAVFSVAFSPDGTTLASTSLDRTIKLWNANTGTMLNTLRGHTDFVFSVAFSPDSKILASGSYDRTVRLWDVSSGTTLKTLLDASFVSGVTFSPDGTILASGSGDSAGGGNSNVRLWNVGSGSLIRTLSATSFVWSVAFSPDGKALTSSSSEGTVWLWDVGSGKLINTLSDHIAEVNGVAYSPDGKTILSGGKDGIVRLWDASNGNVIKNLYGNTGWVDSVAYSPDGKTVASGGNDAVVRIWEIDSGVLRSLPGHDSAVWGLAFSPDSKILASGSYDNTIRLWDTTNGNLLRTLTGHTSHVWIVAFSPDGKTLVSSSEDQTVRLWDVDKGVLLHTLSGHTGDVRSVAFSPDGKTIASSSVDQTIRLWSADSGIFIRAFQGVPNFVNSIAFSPDGQTLVSGSTDHTVQLWNTSNGTLLTTLFGHMSEVWSVAFSPDGRNILSGGLDGTIRLWGDGSLATAFAPVALASTATDTATTTIAPTATAIPPATMTPTPVSSITVTPPTRQYTQTVIPTVMVNGQWTPVIQTFDGVEMVLVPPGCFLMGTAVPPAGDLFVNEAPASLLCFNQPFWIDRFDVTNAQFTRLNGQAERDSVWTSDNRPRESITWLEARNFCVNQRQARLPTEAEWEYAARGPSNLNYTWGDFFDSTKVVWNSNTTADVGSLPAGMSWVGALDLSGNVWQWTSSSFRTYPYRATDGREDNFDTALARVERGGGYYMTGSDGLRAAVRFGLAPDTVNSNLGFRCTRPYNGLTPVALASSAIMTPVPVSSIVPGHVTAVYVDDFDGSTLSDYWSVDSNQHTFSDGVLSFDVNEKVSGKLDGLYRLGFTEGDGFLIVFRYPAATPIGSIGFLGSKTSGIEAWALNMRASIVQSRTDDYFTSLRNPSFTANVWYSMLVYIDQNRTFYTYIWQRDKPTQYLAAVNAKPPWTSPSWAFLLHDEGGKLDITHFEQLRFPPGFVMPDKPPG